MLAYLTPPSSTVCAPSMLTRDDLVCACVCAALPPPAPTPPPTPAPPVGHGAPLLPQRHMHHTNTMATSSTQTTAIVPLGCM
jgi:hypothetical protein